MKLRDWNGFNNFILYIIILTIFKFLDGFQFYFQEKERVSDAKVHELQVIPYAKNKATMSGFH